MNDSNKTENTQLEVAKGNSSMEEADLLYANKKYDGAVSRAYYAAFHYGCAALFSKGLEAKSHRGLQRLFHLHFIKTGIFDEDIGTILSHAQKAREEADYYPEINFSSRTAGDRIEEAKLLIKAVRSYLVKNGFIQRRVDN